MARERWKQLEQRRIRDYGDAADHIFMPRDLSTQIAILDALDGYALAAQRSITVPLIREWAQTPLL